MADQEDDAEGFLQKMFLDIKNQKLAQLGIDPISTPTKLKSGKTVNVEKDGTTSVFEWEFVSGSSPEDKPVVYHTLLREDGSLSCDCRGWIYQRKDKDGKLKPRSCKHVTMVAEESKEIYADWKAGQELPMMGESKPVTTVTGRISSKQPNMANLPRTLDKALEESKKKLNDPNSRIRYGRVLEDD